MSALDDFLGGASVAPPRGSSGAPPAAPVVPARDVAAVSTGGAPEEPYGVVEVTLPSEIQVYYQEGPRRLYRIRQLLQPDKKFFEWGEVPSMSEVTKILDKPGLVHWGEKVGINLVQELLRNGWADADFIMRDHGGGDPPWFTGAGLQEIGKTKHLTNYYMKDAAAKRGTSVHQALEGWAMSGQLADPDVFVEQERGYVVGLNKFLTESRFVPSMSEVIVASVEHRVAGRFDLLGEIPEPVELTYHLAKGSENPKRRRFDPTTALVDLKTSKGVYDDHHLQVAGYQGVLMESGYGEADKAYVLRVTSKGNYEFVESTAEWLDFWFLRGLYDGLQDMESRRKERK